MATRHWLPTRFLNLEAPGAASHDIQPLVCGARRALVAAVAALFAAACLRFPYARGDGADQCARCPAGQRRPRRRSLRRMWRMGRLRSPTSPRGCSTRWSTSRPRRPSRAPKARTPCRCRSFPRARRSRISSTISSRTGRGRAMAATAEGAVARLRLRGRCRARASSSPTITSSPTPTRSRSISPTAPS